MKTGSMVKRRGKGAASDLLRNAVFVYFLGEKGVGKSNVAGLKEETDQGRGLSLLARKRDCVIT